MKYETREFTSWEKFTNGITSMARGGWRLHSWAFSPQGVALEFIVAVFEAERDMNDRLAAQREYPES